jgi:hypothetical protein
LLDGAIDSKELSNTAIDLARYRDQQRQIETHWVAVERIAEMIQSAGHHNLARVLRLRPAAEGPALLVLAVRYFFRRAVESDPVLFQGLTFGRLEGVAQQQESGFAALEQALVRHEPMLEKQLAILGEMQSELQELRKDLGRLDIRAEQQRVGEQVRELHREVRAIKELLVNSSANRTTACLELDEPTVVRNHGDVQVRCANHELIVECDIWTNQAALYHDGRLIETSKPNPESTHICEVEEEGETVRYEIIIRGPGQSFLAKPYFTVRRNGSVLFDDR